MKYKIVADSSANLYSTNSNPAFVSVPLQIITDRQQFTDNESLDIKGMVNFLDFYKGKSGTACPNVDDYLIAYGNADHIFCVTITGTLSGSYNSACAAKQEYETAYPGKKVFVINSLSTGPELKLLIERLNQLIRKDLDFDSICREITAYQEKTGLVFALKSLNNLANNGRVSPLIARLIRTLEIRLVGIASESGDLKPLDKPRGEKKALHKLLDRMKEYGYQGGSVRIDHCYNIPAALELKTAICKAFPGADVKIAQTIGLCSFYAEKGGILVGFEKG